MKIINKYIFKELFIVLVIGTVTLTGSLFLAKLLNLTEIMVSKGVSFVNVAKMIIYIVPAILILTIPMSVMVSTVVTFNRISADSEVTALKAGGFSFYQLLAPVMVLSVFTYIIVELLMIYALPIGNQAFRNLFFNILNTEASYEIKPKLFNDDFKDMVIFVNEKEINNPVMKGIFIYENTKNEERRIINAKEGTIFSDKKSSIIQVRLKNGTIHRVGKNKKKYNILKFEKYSLEIKIPSLADFGGKALRKSRELSHSELKEKIAQQKKEGLPFHADLVELHKKNSLPFTCLIFGFIGAPLGIKCSRSGKSGSVAASVFVIVIYYIMLLTGQSLGDTGKIEPFLAMWIPNVVIALIAAYLIYKTANELPFKYSQIIFDKIYWIFEKARGFVTYCVIRGGNRKVPPEASIT
jgi:lipopolysaccharide export system permease protein